MNKYIITSFLSLVLFFGIFTPGVLAMTVSSDMSQGGSSSVGTAGNAGVTDLRLNRDSRSNSTFQPGVGGGPEDLSTVPGANNGFYWLWLLPLLAIPLLYFVWRNSDETSESRGYRE